MIGEEPALSDGPAPGRAKGRNATLAEYTLEELIARWEEFFSELGLEGEIIGLADRYPDERSLKIRFEDLNRFDTDMSIHLLRQPLNVITAGEEAIRRVVPPTEESVEIHLRVTGIPRDSRVQIRDLRAKHLGRFIAVEGLVRKATEVRPMVVDALFQCLRCGTVIKELQEGQAFREPLECYEDQGGCKRSANATKFKLLGEASRYTDTQKVEVQEAPEGLRGGEEPQRLSAFTEDDLTGKINPGMRVILNGVLRSSQKGKPGQKSTLFDIMLDVNSIEFEQVEFEEIEVTADDVKRIEAEAADPDLYRKIVASIAPSIYGLSTEKEALAMQLFSGVPKLMPDGRRIRGDLHLLLVGDPGTAKSELLSYMSRLSPRGIYATGKAASAAGLTAAAVRDEFGEGRWTLEAGALVLADKGLAAIDEIDKMNPQDRSAIHEAMEQQRVSVAKAGITAVLQARCAVLAAANPKFGRFDETKYISEQIDLPPTLLSVAGDSPVLARRGGQIESTTIANLVDPYYKSGHEDQPVDVKDIEVASLEPGTLRISWRPVSHVFRHGYNQPLLRIHLETGRHVTVTPGHSIYGFRNGRVVAIASNHLRVGDYVAIPRRIPAALAGPMEYILPRELLRLPSELREGIYLHGVPDTVFERLSGLPPHWRTRQMLSLDRADELDDSELRKCTLHVYGGSGASMPTVVPVDGRLMRFLGYFVAEGSALISGSRSHVISFALGPKDQAIVDDLHAISRGLFGAEISHHRYGTAWKSVLSNKVVFLFLVHVLGIALGAHNKRVPQVVLNSSPDLQLEFVHAYWAGDAGVTVSRTLMSDLLYMFLFDGKVASTHFDGKARTAFIRGRPITSHGVYQLVSPRPPRFTNRGYYANLPKHLVLDMFKSVSDVDIARDFTGKKAGVGRSGISPRWWMAFTGPRISRRIRGLASFSQWIDQEGYETSWSLVDGGGQSFVQNWRRRGLLERRDRDEWSTAYEYRLSEKGFAALGDFRFTERFLQSDIALVRIKTIETAPAARFVYDLSVPGNENFIAGFGGVVCHNSRFDAIFSLIDRPESERDRNLAEHILRGHLVGEWLRRKGEGKEVYGEKPEFTEPYTPHFEPIFFRKYVAYAKRVSPVMTPDAMEAIKTKYLEIRKAGEPAGSSVPITPRQLEAIIRLSEASARARLSASVAVEDTDRAIRITEYWMRRVAGEEGRFDIDIVQVGISQSQRDQIITLRDVINQLSEQSPAGSADYEDIVRIAGERGIPQVKVDQWLKRWAQEGEVYTPGKNRYKLVERL